MILFPFLKIGNFNCRQVGILIVAHHTKGFEKNLRVVGYLDWLVAVYELVRVTLWYYKALKNIGGFSGTIG